MKFPFIHFGKKSFKEGMIKKDEEIGKTGTQIYGGVITNQDYVPELTSSQALSTYEKMRKSDGVVGAALLACELPIRAAHFYIEPASDDKQDQEIAEFIEYNLMKGMTITWDDFLRQALLMLPFGFMCFEKVFTAVNYKGKTYIGWKKFAPRLPSTIYKWKLDNGRDGIVQMLPDGTQVSIPIEKLLIFTHRKEGDNWTGVSILRNAYRSWYIKNHIEKVNAIAIERQGIGIPKISLPANYTPADRERAKEIAKNIRANQEAYILEPEGWSIEFVDMKGNSVIDPTPTVNRLNREILISVLAQFMDLGSGTVGSRALSVDQSTIFHNNLKALANQICDVINNYAIKQLVDINWTVKNYPTLKYTRIGKLNLNDFSVAIQRLSMAGALTPDPDLEDYIRETMNLPKKTEEEAIAKPAVPKTKEEKTKIAKEFSEEWTPPRPLTFAEHKVKWLDVRRKFQTSEIGIRKELDRVLKKIKIDLVKKVQRALSTPSNTGKRKKLLNLSTGYQAEYRKIVYKWLKDVFEYGKMSAAHEMRQSVPTTPADRLSKISNQADMLTQTMNNDLVKEAKIAVVNALEHKKFDDVPLSLILAAVSKAVSKKSKSLLTSVPSIVVSGALNQGRRLSFKVYDNLIYALQRSEILDERTCSFCESMDMRVVKKNDPITNEDGFHISCRGLWVEIMKDELEKPEIKGIPDSLRKSYHGFNAIS